MRIHADPDPQHRFNVMPSLQLQTRLKKICWIRTDQKSTLYIDQIVETSLSNLGLPINNSKHKVKLRHTAINCPVKGIFTLHKKLIF
jgi:hypothetical protein